MNVSELAWCAGVIDAMGIIRTRRMKTGSELGYVGVSSSKRDILKALADMTGTGITAVHRDYKRLGCNVHCEEPHLHVTSSTGRWSLTGARAAVFLLAIEPYLVIKKGAANDAIAAGLIAPRKDATLAKMYKLGWPRLEEAA
jgi:hypothetical protein